MVAERHQRPPHRGSYCGPLGLSIPQVLMRSSHDDTRAWFSGGLVKYVHMGRTAIHHAARLVTQGASDEVLVPSYNCGTEIDALLKGGCALKVYRIDERATVDVDDLEAKITRRTKAIYATHYFGFPCAVEEIRELCDARGLHLIEDCALSLFSKQGTKKLGSLGDLAVFSFPKTLPVPDGGALVFNNRELAAREWPLRSPSGHAIFGNLMRLGKAGVLRHLSRGPASRLLGQRKGRSSRGGTRTAEDMRFLPGSYFFEDRVRDSPMSHISERFLGTFSAEEIVRVRRSNYETLSEVFENCDCVRPLFRTLPEGVCPLYFPVFVRERNRLCHDLTARSIAVTPWWAGYHPALSWREFPEACALKDNLLALPVHQQLNLNDMLSMADRIRESIA